MRASLAGVFVGGVGSVVGGGAGSAGGGGAVGDYLNFFAKVKQSGERVVIDGPCLSACTLALSTIPRKRICVTSKAVLGFHAPYLVDKNGRTSHNRDVTRTIDAAYPPSPA